jgi:hypothetical protein
MKQKINIPLSIVKDCRRGGARLSGAVFVLGFAVLTAIGFAGCKAAVLGGDDGEGKPVVAISLSKSEDIIFKDELELFTPTELKAIINPSLLEVVDLAWSITGDDILTNPPADGSSNDTVTIEPNGNAGKVTLTATITSKIDENGNEVVKGLNSFSSLSASYDFSVLEPPVVTINAISDIPLEAGNKPRERNIIASLKLDDYTPSEWIPAPGNILSSFVWEFVSGDDKAEFVPGTESVSGTSLSVTLKANTPGSAKIKGTLTLPGEKTASAEATFNIINYDPAQEPHTTIKIAGAPTRMTATETKAFSVSFTPSTASFSSIKFECVEDKNRFVIDETNQNNITIKALGGISKETTYTIKAKSIVPISTAEDTFEVTVSPVTVGITGSTNSLSKGGTATYGVNVNLTGNTGVNWSIDPSSQYATISSSGVLTNTKSVSSNQTITVKATSKDDTSRFDTKTVTLTPPKYTVKYNANGGDGTMADETNKTYGTSFTLKANSYTKKGFVFNNWNTTNTGGGTSYGNQANVNIDPVSDGATVTLYAQWIVPPPTTITEDGAWNAPIAGTYTIEVWGAQGTDGGKGSSSKTGGVGGLGGYSKGEKITLNAGDVLTLKVGKQNGGGSGGKSCTSGSYTTGTGGGGGGKTEVLKGTEVLIVAGGGGGGGGVWIFKYNGTNNMYFDGSEGGAGGGHGSAPGNGGVKTASGGTGGSTIGGSGGTGGNDARETGVNGFDSATGIGGGGGGGGLGYKKGEGGCSNDASAGGGGGSGYAKTGTDGFQSATGQTGVQSGNGKIVITYVQ